MKEVQYNGNQVFKNVSFGLYGYDNIEFDETLTIRKYY